jgi:hypothetical protein
MHDIDGSTNWPRGEHCVQTAAGLILHGTDYSSCSLKLIHVSVWHDGNILHVLLEQTLEVPISPIQRQSGCLRWAP